MRPKSQKWIKNSAESFECSEFYPIAEPSLAEPFFKLRRAKKDSVGKTQNSDGFGLNSNGFVLNPDGFGVNPKDSVFFRRNLFCSAELKKRLCKRGFCYRVKFRTFKEFC